MTLQQLRYLIAIAEYGSINAAAQNLYASQSNLSTAIKELEQELGITVFTRSNRGVTLTNDGTELLGYAHQVIEQADMLERRYATGTDKHLRLAVSTQHYAFSVQAFVNVVEQCEGDDYEFILRESSTGEIIDDVRTFRSEVGVLYTDGFNRRVLQKAFDDADVAYAPLFDARVHVFVGEHHPLAGAQLLAPEDLEPLPALLVRAGHGELVLLLRGAAQLPPARAQHPHLGPRHAHEPANQPQRLHAVHGRAVGGDAVGHCQHPARRGRAYAGGLHHAQRTPPEPPAAALHRRAPRHHRGEPERGSATRLEERRAPSVYAAAKSL